MLIADTETHIFLKVLGNTPVRWFSTKLLTCLEPADAKHCRAEAEEQALERRRLFSPLEITTKIFPSRWAGVRRQQLPPLT